MIDIIQFIQVIQPAIMAALTAALTGGAVGYYLYKNQVVDPTIPSPIRDNWQLASSAILGAGIGLVLYFSGLPVNEANILLQMATYGFLSFIIERGLKTLWRRIKWKHPTIYYILTGKVSPVEV